MAAPLVDQLLAYIKNDLNWDAQEPDQWHSLDVNYEPPHVERVWKQLPSGDARIYLHRIHPCEPGEALFHPHPWPSAVYIIDGQYEMGVGYGAGETAPPVLLRSVLRQGSYYEMSDPDAWHWVRPLGGPSLSVMITGAPWDRWSPAPETRLGPLTDAAKVSVLDAIWNVLPRIPDRPFGTRGCVRTCST